MIALPLEVLRPSTSEMGKLLVNDLSDSHRIL
jgi:hypothetical protein